VKLLLLESVWNNVRLTSTSACSTVTPWLMMRIDFFIIFVLVVVCLYVNNFKIMLTFCDKKGEYFLVFRPGMCFQTGQVFLSQNGQIGSLLVFYWLHSG
jgi:hypothetical protein